MEEAGGRVSQRRDDHLNSVQMAGAQAKAGEGSKAKAQAGTEARTEKEVTAFMLGQ